MQVLTLLGKICWNLKKNNYQIWAYCRQEESLRPQKDHLWELKALKEPSNY